MMRRAAVDRTYVLFALALKRRCSFSSHFVCHLQVAQSVDDAGEYVPRPIDTSKIKLGRDLTSLVELLSKNTHDVSENAVEKTYSPHAFDECCDAGLGRGQAQGRLALRPIAFEWHGSRQDVPNARSVRATR